MRAPYEYVIKPGRLICYNFVARLGRLALFGDWFTGMIVIIPLW